MNNLHRELAPISDAAWDEIEEEARRTFTRHVAGRRVVDVVGPAGPTLSAVGTGHVAAVDAPADGRARRQPPGPAGHRAAGAVHRHPAGRRRRRARRRRTPTGSRSRTPPSRSRSPRTGRSSTAPPRPGSSASRPAARIPPCRCPATSGDLPDTVAQALSALRLAGVDGPYSLLLSADLYTAVAETTDHGYPIRDHLARLLHDGEIIWAPALDGALLVSTRGGDYELHLGQDLSIGYLSHDAERVELYLQESLTFLALTAESSVVLTS